jgi:DNA-binding MarR family transcriptional regulator
MDRVERSRAQIEERLLTLILRANRARIYDDLLRGADVAIDSSLYPVLSATAAIGPARVSELAEVVGLNPTTMSRHLRELERIELVSRTNSDSDRRATMVELTELGSAIVARLRDQRRELFSELLEGFAPEELDRFADYLERLIAGFVDRSRGG